jgi:hypothetical protein
VTVLPLDTTAFFHNSNYSASSQLYWQQLSHRKQDEDKEINKTAEHKTQNNAENQNDGQH